MFVALELKIATTDIKSTTGNYRTIINSVINNSNARKTPGSEVFGCQLIRDASGTLDKIKYISIT